MICGRMKVASLQRSKEMKKLYNICSACDHELDEIVQK